MIGGANAYTAMFEGFAMRVLKLLLIGGALFLLPLLLLWVLLAKALDLALVFMRPIESALPGWTIVDVQMPHLAAVLVILVFCLIAGLCAQQSRAQDVWQAPWVCDDTHAARRCGSDRQTD
jgi:hypothetical protein